MEQILIIKKGVNIFVIYKVLYQPSKDQSPHRENTESLYVEAESIVEARQLVADNTPYRIDFVQELSKAHLEYEQSHNPDFEVVTF